MKEDEADSVILVWGGWGKRGKMGEGEEEGERPT